MRLRNGKRTRHRLISEIDLSSDEPEAPHIPTPRNSDGQFNDIGHLIASIPSATVRNQIFKYVDNRTRTRLLQLFAYPEHQPFLYSVRHFWRKITLKANRRFFAHIAVLEEFLANDVKKIYLNCNVYFESYELFTKSFQDPKNSHLVDFLRTRVVSFDNYDVMMLDKLDVIYEDSRDDDEFEPLKEVEFEYLAAREYQARLTEVTRNYKVTMPGEIMRYYISEQTFHSAETIQEYVEAYQRYEQVTLAKQFKIWQHIDKIEMHMRGDSLFRELELFTFTSLTALHVFGGYLEDCHGKSLAAMPKLENLSIYGEYVLCPYFDADTFRMYTQSPMVITDEFFKPFVAAKRNQLRYLEYVDYTPIDDYEVLEVWSHDEIARFSDCIDQINLRATYYSAGMFRDFLTSSLSPSATAVHLCANSVILPAPTITAVMNSCPKLEELSLKHCVDYKDLYSEINRGYEQYDNKILVTESLANVKKLQLYNMFFDVKSLFTELTIKEIFPRMSSLMITCSRPEKRYLHKMFKRFKKGEIPSDSDHDRGDAQSKPRSIRLMAKDPRYWTESRYWGNDDSESGEEDNHNWEYLR